jgi:hypothetical protein
VGQGGQNTCSDLYRGSAREVWPNTGHRRGSLLPFPGARYHPDPVPACAELRHYVAFYPVRLEACYVDGGPVQAQAQAGGPHHPPHRRPS